MIRFRSRGVLAGIVAAFIVCAASPVTGGQKSRKTQRTIVQMFGLGTFLPTSPPELVEFFGVDAETFGCFEVALVDPRNGKRVGTANECFREDDDGSPGDFIGAFDTFQIFHLKKGRIVNKGRATSTPHLAGIPGQFVSGQKAPGDMDTIVHQFSTGKWRRVSSGRFRLSGLLDVTSGVFFDCIFFIDTEK